MDSSVSLRDQIWFLRVCHHVSNVLYICTGLYSVITFFYPLRNSRSRWTRNSKIPDDCKMWLFVWHLIANNVVLLEFIGIFLKCGLKVQWRKRKWRNVVGCSKKQDIACQHTAPRTRQILEQLKWKNSVSSVTQSRYCKTDYHLFLYINKFLPTTV